MIPPFLPVLWPAEYGEAALRLGPGSPLLRMVEPHPSEGDPDPEGSADPCAEARFSPVPFVVRKHRDRAVVLATSRCFSYCRFCFRRAAAPGPAREPGPDDWERVLHWLKATPEVREVILTGGDPLALCDEAVEVVASQLARTPGLQSWRIHTRAPIVQPSRVTSVLLRALRSPLPLRVVVHANHPAEFGPSAAGALQRFQDSGVPVSMQSVLLAGVNDSPDVLAELFEAAASLGVAPRYLHHPDRACGNARFRLPLTKGLGIYRDLRGRSSSPVPPYVVDLPNGAGKCPVEDLRAVAEERGPGGRRIRYRWTRPATWDGLAAEPAFEWWDVRSYASARSRGIGSPERRASPLGIEPPNP